MSRVIALGLEVDAAVEKVNKYAVSESGDTVELVERPHGGVSIVVADGQRSGQSAKAISNMVVQKAIALLAEGVRDGATARATHDYLLLQRGGKVSAELAIVSVDLVTRTLVVSRNSRCPVLLRQGDVVRWLDAPSEAIGVRRNTKPAIDEMALAADITVVVGTDGVWTAGSRRSRRLDLALLLAQLDPQGVCPASELAHAILDEAVRLDEGRPLDDTTVLVLKLTARPLGADESRRLTLRFPI